MVDNIEIKTIKCSRLAFYNLTQDSKALISDAVVRYVRGVPNGISCENYIESEGKCRVKSGSKMKPCFYSSFNDFT